MEAKHDTAHDTNSARAGNTRQHSNMRKIYSYAACPASANREKCDNKNIKPKQVSQTLYDEVQLSVGLTVSPILSPPTVSLNTQTLMPLSLSPGEVEIHRHLNACVTVSWSHRLCVSSWQNPCHENKNTTSCTFTLLPLPLTQSHTQTQTAGTEKGGVRPLESE